MFIPLTLTCVKLPHSCNKENSWMPVALSPLACHWAVLPVHPPCSRDLPLRAPDPSCHIMDSFYEGGMAQMALGASVS